MRAPKSLKTDGTNSEWLTSPRGYPSGHYWDVCDKLVRLKIFDSPVIGRVTLSLDAEERIKERARQIRTNQPRKTAEKTVTQAVMLEIVERVGTIKVKNWVDMASMVLGYIRQTTTSHSRTLNQWLDDATRITG